MAVLVRPVAAIITAVVWIFVQPEETIYRVITVLVIACPHASGLAIPLVVSIATERAAKAGVLIKDRVALETVRTVNTVLFDKTGTLTNGTPSVDDVVASRGGSPTECWLGLPQLSMSPALAGGGNC